MSTSTKMTKYTEYVVCIYDGNDEWSRVCDSKTFKEIEEAIEFAKKINEEGYNSDVDKLIDYNRDEWETIWTNGIWTNEWAL